MISISSDILTYSNKYNRKYMNFRTKSDKIYMEK